MNKTAPIITRDRELEHVPDWQRALAEAIQRPADLLAALGLPAEPATEAAMQAAAGLFPLRVPRGFVARMRPGDRHDPLLLQVLPDPAECDPTLGYVTDPLAEAAAMRAPGLLHKYAGRVLLTLTGACGIHCRYCFRRHYPYAEANPAGQHWAAALSYIASDTSLTEVILSGGDPLSWSDARLAARIEDLAAIPHLTRLRVHSRLPIVVPERITETLVETLTRTRLNAVLVVHANHPNEIDGQVHKSMEKLKYSGVTLLNQAVLLRAVNDNAEVLAQLSERLFEAGVLPYYLHQLDRVQGAAHFEVEAGRAVKILRDLQARLPGYLIPRLVREDPGAPSKTPL